MGSQGGADLISLFVATHDKGREVAQDKIKFKNQLQSAHEALESMGRKPRERSDRLALARDLLDDVEFWEHQRAGLAVYIDDDGQVTPFSLGRPAKEAAHVLPVFHLRPTVGEIKDFTLPTLVLTKSEVALFSVTATSARTVKEAFPNMDEVNWFVDREKQRQQHPGRAGGDPGRHGHGTADGEDEDLRRFLREVDSALSSVGVGDRIVVLGDDDLVARFSNQTGLTVHSPDNSGLQVPITEAEVLELTAGELALRESEWVESETERLGDKLGQGQGSSKIEESLAAARNGRVETLLIHRGAQPQWGRFDEQTQTVDEHSEYQIGDVDLLDRLVVWSFENGADVVPSEEPIDGRPFLTAFRY